MSRGLATFAEAVTWAQDHWEGRPVPIKLHSGGVEPDSQLGAPAITVAFLAYLQAQPGDTWTTTEEQPCHHPGRTGANICRDCAVYDEHGKPLVESGVRKATRIRWRYPMWRALDALSRVPAIRPAQPPPLEVVLALSLLAWDGKAAARHFGLAWEMFEALAIISLRKLHSRYSEGPIPRPSWIDRSESQRNAEGDGEAA